MLTAPARRGRAGPNGPGALMPVIADDPFGQKRPPAAPPGNGPRVAGRPMPAPIPAACWRCPGQHGVDNRRIDVNVISKRPAFFASDHAQELTTNYETDILRMSAANRLSVSQPISSAPR